MTCTQIQAALKKQKLLNFKKFQLASNLFSLCMHFYDFN